MELVNWLRLLRSDDETFVYLLDSSMIVSFQLRNSGRRRDDKLC
jgi:hypothetical protein